ncbi:MAG: hypothetical protein QM594_20130 [Niabella sp.]
MYIKQLLFIFTLFIAPAVLSQQGYTANTGEAVWGGVGERRDISLTSEGDITNGGEAFRLESLMPANPTNNSTPYRFDYKIVQHVTTPIYKGQIVYYVNSRDGSIAFTAEDNPKIKERIRRDMGDFHFGIRKASGNILICGLYKNDRTGRMEKRGVDLGADHDVNAVLGEMLFDQMVWLNNAAALSSEGLEDALTPRQIEILESSSVDGMRGKVSSSNGGSDQVIDFYFIPYPVMERVSVPFMGLNAGIMKNYKKTINQLVIYSVVRDVQWKGSRTDLHFYLDGLYKADATFRPGDYSIMTAFNKRGAADFQALQADVMQTAQRIEQLKRLIKNCPKGEEGKACREPYQKELKELEKKIEQQAERFMQKHQL